MGYMYGVYLLIKKGVQCGPGHNKGLSVAAVLGAGLDQCRSHVI